MHKKNVIQIDLHCFVGHNRPLLLPDGHHEDGHAWPQKRKRILKRAAKFQNGDGFNPECGRCRFRTGTT